MASPDDDDGDDDMDVDAEDMALTNPVAPAARFEGAVAGCRDVAR